MTANGSARRLYTALFRREYGTPAWDGVLRGSGLIVLLAIPLTVVLPQTGGLVGFTLITIWLNGPLSPMFPSTYEPILMVFGRVYAPVLVAAIGTTGIIFVEYLNYHLYTRVLQVAALERMRRNRTVRWVVDLFSKAPFLAIWLCSWSIFPYWPIRFVSPLARYPIERHLTATTLGRFPRLWFFAALGTWWNVPLRVLVAISAASITIALTVYGLRRRRAYRDRARRDSSNVADLKPAES